MPTELDILPTLALQQAKSPVVRELFTLFEHRARALASLQDQFSAALIHDREAPEGKPFCAHSSGSAAFRRATWLERGFFRDRMRQLTGAGLSQGVDTFSLKI